MKPILKQPSEVDNFSSITPSQTGDSGENQPTVDPLGLRLRQWTRDHEWERVGAITHRFNFERKFAKELLAMAVRKEAKGQKVLACQISEAYQAISHLCGRIDHLTRKGCENEEELGQLESAKTGAKAALGELIGLIDPSLSSDRRSKRPRKQRLRACASSLSPREQCIWALVRVQGKTVGQAAIELSCSRQNISKYLNSAEKKMKAERSRSVVASSNLPHDSRGQVCVSSDDDLDD